MARSNTSTASCKRKGAYAKACSSDVKRPSWYPDFIEYYSQRRPHTALKGASLATLVPQYTGPVHLDVGHKLTSPTQISLAPILYT